MMNGIIKPRKRGQKPNMVAWSLLPSNHALILDKIAEGSIIKFGSNVSASSGFRPLSNFYECNLKVGIPGIFPLCEFDTSEAAWHACCCAGDTHAVTPFTRGGDFSRWDALSEKKRAYWGSRGMLGIIAKTTRGIIKKRKVVLKDKWGYYHHH